MISTCRPENLAAVSDDCFGVTTALIIGAGIAAAGSVASSKIQSNAAKKAGEQQVAATDTARADLAPYNQTGLNASNALGYLMGISPNLPTNKTMSGNGMNVPGGSALFPGGVGSPQGNSAGFLMQAPDGTQKLVPASQVEHYKGLGATVLEDKTGPGTPPPFNPPVGMGRQFAAPPTGTAVPR